MVFCDGESDSDLFDDDLYSSFVGLDINIDDFLDFFLFDMDEDDDLNFQLFLEIFFSQISDLEGFGFWFSELYFVLVVLFLEEIGLSYDLMLNDNILSYFFLMVLEVFFERVFNEINRYVVQEFEKRGYCDVDWIDIFFQEIKVYFGLYYSIE